MTVRKRRQKQVIGGVASVLHGVPRATFDIDIFIEANRENGQRLLDAMLVAGMRTASLTDVEALLAHEITIFKDWIRVDVQTRTPGLDFASAWKRRETVQYDDQPMYVVCRVDLIASKQAAGRPVDLEDVRLLKLPEK